MNTNDFIVFSVDWNAGMTANELAEKYNTDVAVVRSWVASLRKKGVKLTPRRGGIGDIDVKKINDNL